MVLLLALSLAMDAFAVSVASSLSVPDFKKSNLLWLAGYFGVFQMGMTLIGAFLGEYFSGLVGELGRLIAFALLVAIGANMLWSALRPGREAARARSAPGLTHQRMLVLAIATSIDAAAAGVTLGLQQASVWLDSIIIGIVAFGFSIAGGLFGGRVGARFQTRAALIGGLVLIALGIWSLFS